jgi:hypothetical protein
MADILNPDEGEEREEVAQHQERIQELKEAARRGDFARMLDQSPLFDEYFNSAKAQIVEAITNSDPKDDEARYRLTVALQVLDKMRGFVSKVAQDGEFSEKQLSELTGKKRKRFF